MLIFCSFTVMKKPFLHIAVWLILIGTFCTSCKRTELNPEPEVPTIPSTGESPEVKSIFASSDNSFFIKPDNTLWVAGYNFNGQLGNLISNYNDHFIKITEDVKSLNIGDVQSMIIKSDNSLWAAGKNSSGQLGNGSTNSIYNFEKVAEGVKAVSSKGSHTLLVKTDNSLWAAGLNYSGQLGDGTTINKQNFVKIMDDVKAVDANDYFSLIIKTDNSLWGSGINYDGIFGDATLPNNKSSFVKIIDDVKSVAAGFNNHVFILKTDNTLWESNGKSGFDFIADGIKSVTLSYDYYFILKTDNTLWATGANSFGQLGNGTNTPIAGFEKIADGVRAVATGYYINQFGIIIGRNQYKPCSWDCFSLIIKTDDTLWGTGSNNNGQLGDGTKTNRSSFVKIADNIKAAGTGNFHSLTLLSGKKNRTELAFED